MTSKYALNQIHTIKARSGVAVPLSQNQTIKIINTHGTQVIDFWAFSSSTLTQHLSMSHTRTATLHLSPHVNDTLVTSQRVPILTLIEDTTAGVHDTLIAACDINRYHQLGVPKDEYHDSCADNLRNALARDVNQVMPEGMSGPDPLNLFMNVPVSNGGSGKLSFEAPVCEKGQYVVFQARMDCCVVMSACPQDLIKVNDTGPVEAHFVVA